jgi:hypothetical protein
VPDAIPAHHRSQLSGLLAIAGAAMADDPHDPTTHTIRHNGATWTATYGGSFEGEPFWRLVGPAHPEGIDLDKYGITDTVTRFATPG